MIDHELSPEIARLSRWTFARALLVEALKTGKARDLNTAFRQLKQALTNENWLTDRPARTSPGGQSPPRRLASNNGSARKPFTAIDQIRV